MPALNLHDVAREAGCSHMTVSRVLRGTVYVSPALQKKVLAAVKKLGYRRSPLLSAWMAQVKERRRSAHGDTLAYISGFSLEETLPHSHLGPDWIAARDQAQALGFSLLFLHAGQNGLNWKRISRIISARSIRGVILASFINQPEAKIELPWDQIGVVCLGSSQAVDVPVTRIGRGNFEEVRAAYLHLSALGYRRIALAMLETNYAGGGYRAAGSFLELQSHSPAASRLPLLLLPNLMGGPEVPYVAHYIRTHRPDVIIGGHFFADYVKTAGLRIPDDVAFWYQDLSPAEAQSGRYAGFLTISGGPLLVDIVSGMVFRNELGPPPLSRFISYCSPLHDGASAPPRVTSGL